MENVVIALEDSHALAQSLADRVHCPLVIADVNRFSDGELTIDINNPAQIKNKRALIVHSTCPPVQDRLIELLFICHTLQVYDVDSIIAIIPYFGYARHDKSSVVGKPGEVAMVLKMLGVASISQIYTVELHEPAIVEISPVPLVSLSIDELICADIKKRFAPLDDVCIIAPDAGAAQRNGVIADALDLSLGIFLKERYAPDKTKIVGFKGECAGKRAIIIDDMIDTGRTAFNVADALKKHGIKKVYGYFVHPVLSGNAVKDVATSSFDQIFVANTIPVAQQKKDSTIKVLDIGAIIADKIAGELS